MCKVTPYLQGVSVSASVSTLAAIAVDRYIYIIHFYTTLANLSIKYTEMFKVYTDGINGYTING